VKATTGGGWSPTSGFDKAKLAANFTGNAATAGGGPLTTAANASVASNAAETKRLTDYAAAAKINNAAVDAKIAAAAPGAAPVVVPKDVGFLKELAANVKPIAPQLASAAALTSFDKEPEGPYVPIPETPFDPTIRATDYLYGVGRKGAYNPQTGTFMPPPSPQNPNGGDVAPVGMGLPQSAAMPQLMSAAQFGYLNARTGGRIAGPGDGKSDDIPALLSNGEHVIDAATVSDLGNGDNDTGQKRLEEIKHKIRSSAGRKNPRKASPKQKGLGSLLNSARA
jgi:hypothetical protein